MGFSPHLHIALSTYIYLHLALDSSPPRSLKNRGQREEMGYGQTHVLSTQSPGRQVTRSQGLALLCKAPLQMEAQGFPLGALTSSSPYPVSLELHCTPPTQEAGPCWATGLKRHLGDREIQRGGRGLTVMGAMMVRGGGRSGVLLHRAPHLHWPGVWAARSDGLEIEVAASPLLRKGHIPGGSRPSWAPSGCMWLSSSALGTGHTWLTAQRHLSHNAFLPPPPHQQRGEPMLSWEPRSSLT